MKPVKRTIKIDNADLFTTAAREHYQKHIKTQSKQTLSFINEKIDWKKLLQPIERVISQEKAGISSSGRPGRTHSLCAMNTGGDVPRLTNDGRPKRRDQQ